MESSPHHHTKYSPDTLSDRLVPSRIKDCITTSVVARNILYFQSIDSTNRIAGEYARQGCSDGTLVIAEEQTAGRGRFSRTWISPARSSILCSLIFYPSITTASLFKMTMLASIAVVRAIHALCNIDSFIKWPNDVYVNGKKVCGILTEFESDHDILKYVVVGIGINVNQDMIACPEINTIAVSLKEACGKIISRLALLKELLEEIDRLYRDFLKTGGTGLRSEWMKHSGIMNRHVLITDVDTVTSGIVKDITDDGHLMLEDEQGSTHEILCGDVSLQLE